ncbi:hypothetical protein WJX73_002023 [Symbiochloris irregularis]|uniref:Uncharacterized protein n=1 Tax=Symbiochloris irregularis TaxID=706552 RepID=A0AAW1NNX7_9CHLO
MAVQLPRDKDLAGRKAVETYVPMVGSYVASALLLYLTKNQASPEKIESVPTLLTEGAKFGLLTNLATSVSLSIQFVGWLLLSLLP